MTIKNNKAIVIANLYFTLGVIVCVALTLLAFFMYIQTLRNENKLIEATMARYDQTYAQQLDASTKIDSLVTLMQTVYNENPTGGAGIKNIIINRKTSINSHLSSIQDNQVPLHLLLMEQMNTFLKVKDSLRTLCNDENVLKTDLSRCINDFNHIDQKRAMGNVKSR